MNFKFQNPYRVRKTRKGFIVVDTDHEIQATYSNLYEAVEICQMLNEQHAMMREVTESFRDIPFVNPNSDLEN